MGLSFLSFNILIKILTYLQDEDSTLEAVQNGSTSSLTSEHCHLPRTSNKASRRAMTKLATACCFTTIFMVKHVEHNILLVYMNWRKLNAVWKNTGDQIFPNSIKQRSHPLFLSLQIGEAVGGYLANSIAIMSDAAHLLSDLTSFIVSMVAIFLAMRPASKRMNYGYHRAGMKAEVITLLHFSRTSALEHILLLEDLSSKIFFYPTEVLGAVISVLLIWIITGILVYAAIQRITTMDFEVESDTMIIVAAIGVVINIM